MFLYYGIDGTDNHDKTTLPPACLTLQGTQALDSAHVRRMGALGFNKKQYVAGTQDSITGASSAAIIERAMAWIETHYGAARDDSRKLFLGGFSRGGAAIVVIANKLAKKGIPVQEMYIFDAVDRSGSMDNSLTATIPKTVVRAFHALRHPKAGSRRTFGNCGTESAHGNLARAYFETTHGGIGGWPNGEERVKPGVGSEDYAYFTMAGAAGGAALAAMDPRQDNIHEFGAPFPTNIKPDQELVGMRAAWTWMYSNAFSTIGQSTGM